MFRGEEEVLYFKTGDGVRVRFYVMAFERWRKRWRGGLISLVKFRGLVMKKGLELI